MTTDNTADAELDQVRRILLGPIEQNNDARDKRIMDFIKAETTANAEHLDRMETRIREITTMVNTSRRETLGELSRAIADLAERQKGPVPDLKTGELKGNVQAMAATRNSR